MPDDQEELIANPMESMSAFMRGIYLQQIALVSTLNETKEFHEETARNLGRIADSLETLENAFKPKNIEDRKIQAVNE